MWSLTREGGGAACLSRSPWSSQPAALSVTGLPPSALADGAPPSRCVPQNPSSLWAALKRKCSVTLVGRGPEAVRGDGEGTGLSVPAA